MKASYDENILRKIISDSYSIADVLKKLNLVPIGGNYKTVKKYISLYKINTAHFTGALWNKGKKWSNVKARIPLEEILVTESSFNTYSLKNRLFEEGYKQKVCEICTLSEWLSQPIALELHHINGINNDNRLLNLQILCPNCHAHTDNYRGRNQTRVQKSVNPAIIKPESNKRKYLCSCGKEIGRTAKSCMICYKTSIRKVKRPSIEALLADLQGSSFLQVGKKYGVSDNSIRKWIKNN